MRIVLAHSRLASFGGGERCVLELAKGLSKRHDIHLWAGAYDPSATYPELAEFPRIDVPPRGWLTRTPRWADAVVTHSFGAHLLALRHPHTVCYIHTLRSEYLRRGGRPDLVVRRALDGAALHRAYAVATNSEYVARWAGRRYRRPIGVVPPGVDEAFLELPLAAGQHALYAGRLAPEKGLERLLRWGAGMDVDLWLAGAGQPDYVAHLRALAGNRVRFLGALTGQELLDVYRQARMVVFLPYEEEFGLAALEGMASGKPVIGIREGGLPELIEHEQSGLLVSSAEQYRAAVQRLCADDALCIRLGERARTTARAYTWDRYTDAIERLCSDRGA